MMSDADGYAAAAETYWNAGWRGILPLFRGHKGGEHSGLPTGYSGWAGVDPSFADISAWSETFPDGNLCLRLPNNELIAVVGIDCDHYGAKHGADTLAEAIRQWGPLPPTPRSTSREGNPASGIRVFRVAPGTRLATKLAFPDLGLGDVEIIQFHHRYVVSWPSIHPEGRQYWWRNDADQLIGIPVVEELPWLPQTWIDGLRVEYESNLANTPIEIVAVLTDGHPSMMVQARLSQAIKELNLPGQSRHDTCCRHVLALMRMGKSGEPGVKQSLQLLCEVLVAARRVDGSNSPEGTRAEFIRMIDNDNAARELANPGLHDWIRDIVTAAPDQLLATASPAPPNLEPINASTPSGGSEGVEAGRDNTTDVTRPRSKLEEIEQGFWDSRESLRQVWQTSMARMASPWAVLAQCAAKGLTTVRPNATLPPLIGGPGSLNWFAAMVANSGGGKGAAVAASHVLIPDDLIEDRNLGSGEGIVGLFGRSPTDDDPTPIHEALLINVSEVDTLTALSQRSASTTASVLRSAFMGETLGFSYVGKGKARHIPAHTYRMTMTVAVQPSRAGGLLSDEGGGTPQRFMWFPAKDSRISRRNKPWESGPLTLPRPGEWLYPRTLTVPPEAQEIIEIEHEKRQRDEGDALDGHALFCREKFAFALAVLDGRTQMTSEDWELSGIAADLSTFIRERTVNDLKDASRIDALDRGEVRGIELAAADESKQYEEAERVRRALRWALDKIEAAGSGGISMRTLTQSADSKRTRRWLPAALQVATSNGLIRQLEATAHWVKI